MNSVASEFSFISPVHNCCVIEMSNCLSIYWMFLLISWVLRCSESTIHKSGAEDFGCKFLFHGVKIRFLSVVVFNHKAIPFDHTPDCFNRLLDFIFRDENLFARNTSNAQSYTLAYHFLESGVAGVIAFVQLDVNGTQVKSNRIAIGKN